MKRDSIIGRFCSLFKKKTPCKENEIDFEERFGKVTQLDEKQCRVLNSIRFQDEDRSSKLGSLLAFSGLIIATSIVQLATSEDSIVHVSRNNLLLIVVNTIGLILLFSGALISLFALVATGKYSNKTDEALIRFDDYVKVKLKRVKWATVLIFCGTIFILFSLLVVLSKGLGILYL